MHFFTIISTKKNISSWSTAVAMCIEQLKWIQFDFTSVSVINKIIPDIFGNSNWDFLIPTQTNPLIPSLFICNFILRKKLSLLMDHCFSLIIWNIWIFMTIKTLSSRVKAFFWLHRLHFLGFCLSRTFGVISEPSLSFRLDESLDVYDN